MNLFAAAGLDLQSGGAGKRREPTPKLAHIPLFSAKIIKAAISQTEAIEITPELETAAAKYAKLAASAKFQDRNEEAARPEFFRQIMQGILGYRSLGDGETYDMHPEYRLSTRSVDLALGQFGVDGDSVLAPLEMKGPDTPDLDKIMSGRGLSPVQQAWDYAADAPDAKWVMVSNCIELRLYRLGRGRETYEKFDLARLDETDELRRLLLILGARRFLDGGTEALLQKSDAELKAITNALYREYSTLRGEILAYLHDSADGPKFPKNKAIEATQKLLDRILFIAFASGNGMLPSAMFKTWVEFENPIMAQPKWGNVKEYFKRIDKNSPNVDASKDAWPYNGGLFAYDAALDGIDMPDHIVLKFLDLLAYDYGDEISVNVLGRIFEQSITDIEKLRDDAPEEVSQRKRDGVVYTPEHVTRFLVQKTIGITLEERQRELLMAHAGIAAFPADKSDVKWLDDASELAFWQAYLVVLQNLTIVDPACGSGAFLVAAFEALADEYRRTVERLIDLGQTIAFDIFDEILTRNLYGVDLNVESVEIARLALWLKSARRRKRLAKLDHTVQAGNSLIDDAKASDRPFNWQTAFPDVFAAGGFDIVIGNPPYVRMELLKPIKPWLSKHYKVADERTDLYAYFFEQGLRILKQGGRLGYISSSTFFRTGSGEKLRLHLTEFTDIETITDFGDVQIFEGVTTYPAIITAQKRETLGHASGDLSYLNITQDESDLGRAFEQGAKTMPRARLTGGSWQLENEALAKLRAKIITGKKTLKEVYGAPLYGIKTGLNEAFVIDTPTRDRLVKADPKSAELLKPFLKGENVKRWRVESDGLWLINTPRGKIDIEAYPAIRDWLLPFRKQLESRATEQNWWELQQAQLAYQEAFSAPKIIYPDMSQGAKFTLDSNGNFCGNTAYFIPSSDMSLLALLNSKCLWFFLLGQSEALRGGVWRLRLFSENIEQIPENVTAFGQLAIQASNLVSESRKASSAFHTRLLTDLAKTGTRLSSKLRDFHLLDFKELLVEIKRALKADIPVKQRGEWQEFHAEASAEINRLSAEIAAAEAEINALVYQAFELTPDEIELLENSLKGQV
jgi:methylase of polypeptide subunit release factors